VQHARGLVGDGLDQARMVVAEGADGDAGEGIEITLASLVVQPHAVAVREGHGQAGVGVHDMGHGVPRSERSQETRTAAGAAVQE